MRLTTPTAVRAAVTTVTALTALATSTALVAPAVASPAPSRAVAPAAAAGLVTRTAYRNPVSRPFADTFADPSVIRGKDGWWYSYGTSDPLRSGDTTARRIPIAKSHDLVNWQYVGDAFSRTTLPSWAEPNAGLWAPDIRYVNGHYRMYYVVTETKVTTEAGDNAIGMATAPTPAGPWTDSGAPVVGPRRGASGNPGDFLWTFDPAVVTDTNGSQWMFYGSYYGGISVVPLQKNGKTVVRGATPTRVAIDNKFEGAYAVRRGGYWYLFASTANCCAGPTTGYSVQVGRSRSITGPYVDAQGVPLNQSRAGGTPVLNQNGNAWIGSGHNAIATDLAGQDWIVYHAINRNQPFLNEPYGINRRPMLLDRLDWVNGWPAVRAGRGPSAGLQRGPATGGRWVTGFGSGVPGRWQESGRWVRRTGVQSGGFARAERSGTLLTSTLPNRDRAAVRVEADLASSGAAYGLEVRQTGSTQVRAIVDPASRTLRVQQRHHGRLVASAASRLPVDFPPRAWHSVVLQIRDRVATANVTNARLGDPVAVVTLRLRGGHPVRTAGAVAAGRGVDVDNLSVLPAFRPVTRLAATAVPHRLDRSASDEFNGSSLSLGTTSWSWVRPDPAAKVTPAGVLSWPTEAADLTGTSNNAGVLLRTRAPGSGAWTIETKVSIDLGEDTVRNFQQAGLIAYVNDDLFTRFDHVAIWNTRQTEFGKEMTYAGKLSYGGTIVGPPAPTTWLRITHSVRTNGEQALRAWSSRDGHTWIKGGVWTLPASANLRVGLVSHGGEGALAQFDYFRLYR